MNQKTLIINQSIYDLLKMKYHSEQSLLSFSDFIINVMSRHRYMQLHGSADEIHPCAIRTMRNMYLTITTDNDWLLDATTPQINQWLLAEVQEYNTGNCTSSVVVAGIIKTLDWLKIKPDESASWYTPAYLYAAFKKHITHYPTLYDFQNVIFKHACAKMTRHNICNMFLSFITIMMSLLLTVSITLSTASMHLHPLLRLSNSVFNNLCVIVIGLYMLSFTFQSKGRSILRTIAAGLLILSGAVAVNSQMHSNLSTMYNLLYFSNITGSVVMIACLLLANIQIVINMYHVYRRSQSLINIPMSNMRMSEITLYKFHSDQSLTITEPAVVQSDDNQWCVNFDSVISVVMA